MKYNKIETKKKVKVTIKNLLANDFHLGDEVKTWHPSMNASVLGSINVIPLTRVLHAKNRKPILKGRPKIAELEKLKRSSRK